MSIFNKELAAADVENITESVRLMHRQFMEHGLSEDQFYQGILQTVAQLPHKSLIFNLTTLLIMCCLEENQTYQPTTKDLEQADELLNKLGSSQK